MSEEDKAASILSYQTPGAAEPGPPLSRGRRLGFISAFLGGHPGSTPYVVHFCSAWPLL